jgi:hypothetical protein
VLEGGEVLNSKQYNQYVLFIALAVALMLSALAFAALVVASGRASPPVTVTPDEFGYLPFVVKPLVTVTNTRSPYPFTKDDFSPVYLQNFANNAGCNWLGIAGEVFGLDNEPVPYGEYRVHIWDSGIDSRVTVGNAPAYGPSGYEQFLFDAPRVQDHNIQIETANGTAVSQVYRVQTRSSCNQNLLYFVFVQNH